ncbi:MAG: hypothetical protein J7647_01575 [Cyanobacteria bacterium SBLK]|nr:hypothetical protein [Cyanobacteria bacterium SBLK]
MGNTIARDAAAPDFRLMHVALGADLEINETTLSGEEQSGLETEDTAALGGGETALSYDNSCNPVDGGGGGGDNAQ